MPISVRVYPNAKKNELGGVTGGVWQLKVTAPPVEGKANAALITVLSKLLGVSKSRLSIIRGHTGRNKIVAVDSLSDEEVMKRLSSSAASSK